MDNSIGLPLPDELPPIYHLPPNRFFYSNPHDNYWQEATQETIRQKLAIHFGQNPIPAKRGEPSQVDRTLIRIKDEARIDGVACLGWEETGIRIIDGKRVLVEKGCERITPHVGQWQETHKYLDVLLGAEQCEYFLGWLQSAVQGFYFPDKRRYGQALILAGPRGGGKSYLQYQIITKVLGGTIGRPYSWMVGKTPFNSELFECVHLLSEDDYHLADPNSRKMFGASIKAVTANISQEYNKKFGSKMVLKPYWRASFSLNGETHYLAGLPELDASLVDKMMIFQCAPDAIHLPTQGAEGNLMESATNEELPAFIHYLLFDHVVREELQDGRYGIKAYINPRIKEEVDELGEEYLLLECLRAKYAGAEDLKKSSLTIMSDLEAVDVPRAIKNITGRHYALAGCLRKLGVMPGSGIKPVKMHGGTKGWSLNFS